MSRNNILRLLDRRGHLTGVDGHDDDLFGRTWRPICLEDGRHWRGGFIASPTRAQAIGEEHRRKTAGEWRPAW